MEQEGKKDKELASRGRGKKTRLTREQRTYTASMEERTTLLTGSRRTRRLLRRRRDIVSCFK